MNNLLPDDIPRHKKTLFKTFYLLAIYKQTSRSDFYLELMSLCIRNMQYLSIIIFSGYFVKNYSKSTFILNLVSFFRLDYLLVSYDSSPGFMRFASILILLNFFSKSFIFFQLAYKRNLLVSFFVIISKYTNWLISTFIMIPFTFYSFDYIYGCIEGASIIYKNKSVTYYTYYLSIIIPCHIILIILSLSGIIFGNIPNYSNRNSSRVHSSIQLQEFYIVQLLGLISIVVDPSYFQYLFISLSIYLLYCYIYYLPYTYSLLNKIQIQTWSSAFCCCVIVIFSSIFENFFIVELNFPLIYLSLLLISKESFNLRVKMIIKTKKPSNPYTQELKLRFFIQQNPSKEENCKKICETYADSNKRFYFFTMQYIWESILLKKHSKDLSLALVKLVKVNTYLFKSSKTNQPSITYPYKLEVDFLLYSIFSKYSKDVKDSSMDLALIKYFTYFKKISKFDENIVSFLLEFVSALETDTSSKVIKQRIERIGRLIKDYKKLAKKVTGKFGVDKKFARMYGTFLKDILNSAQGSVLLDNYGLAENMGEKGINESSEFDRWDPVLIISGWHKNIGTIVYANSAIYKLLRIDMENKLIGCNFMELIPEPFDAIHDNVLYRFLFHRNSTELTRGHLFLLDVDKYCIEVTMKFKLAFYKYNPYFIASFKVFNSGKNMILCSNEGRIYSYSEGIKFVFTDVNFNIFAALPDIESYLKANDYEEHFSYPAFGRNFYMKKSYLQIDGYEMLVLYLIDYQQVENRRVSIRNRTNKKVVHLEEILEDNHKQSATFKEKELKKDSLSHDILEESDIISFKQAKKASKILSTAIKITVVIELFLTISILLIIIQIIQSLSVNSIIFDIGLMRYLSCSILSNTQSLELLSNNFTLAFNESFYRANLLENSNRLKALIEEYKEITLPFLDQKREYFIEHKSIMFSFMNETFIEEELTLLDSIQKVISISHSFAIDGLVGHVGHLDDKKYLYRNIPSNYINSLHSTVVDVMEDLNKSLDEIFKYLTYLELVCILPPAVLIIIAAFCIHYIEKSNKAFWSSLGSIGRGHIIEAQTRMIERLIFFHEVEYVNENQTSNNKKKIYKRMFIISLLKICLLLILSLVFYFSITFGPQDILLNTIQQQLNHTNYGGMRRMLTPLTLFWSRDSFLYSNSIESYVNKVENYEVSSAYQELEYRTGQLINIQNELMGSIEDFPDKRYSFGVYIKLMFGSACDIIDTIDNCEASLISRGIDMGLKEYVRQADLMKYQEALISKLDLVEKYSKVIEKSFVFGLSVYANYTYDIEENLKDEMTIATFIFLFVLLFFYAMFLHGLAGDMIRNIESKAEILSVFIKNPKKQIKKTRSTTFFKNSRFSSMLDKSNKYLN